MSEPCSSSKTIDRLATSVNRLEQKDEFKDRLLEDLREAIGRLDNHMARQTETMQQILVQKEQILGLRKDRNEDRALIDKLFESHRGIMEQFTSHQLEPIADRRKLRIGTLQTIINTAISTLVSTGLALFALLKLT